MSDYDAEEAKHWGGATDTQIGDLLDWLKENTEGPVDALTLLALTLCAVSRLCRVPGDDDEAYLADLIAGVTQAFHGGRPLQLQ